MVLASVLGDAFGDLPLALQDFHSGRGEATYRGTADVAYGSRLALWIGRLGGFPKPGLAVPLGMHIRTIPGGEIWDRDFGGHVLRSTLWQDGPRTVCERLGRVVVRMQPQVRDGALSMPVVGVSGLGIPVPPAFLGQSGGQERMTADGRIAFDVMSNMRVLGLLIRYSGSLQRAAPHQA